MGYIRPIATVTVEPPHIDGMIAPGGHHWGHNWEFEDDPQRLVPQWLHAGTEYIPAMRAVAPLAYSEWANMVLTDWQAYDYSDDTWGGAESHDDWRLSRPSWGTPRIQYLHLQSATAGVRGRIKSEASFAPHVHVRMVRMAPVDGETRVPRAYVELLGDGTNTYSYGLVLPWETATIGAAGAKAQLFRWPYGEDSSTATVPIAEHEVAYGGLRAAELEVIIEQLGDYLRIAWPIEGSEDWLVRNADDPLVAGPIVMGLVGQCGHLAATERSVLGADSIWYREDVVEGVRVLRWVAEEPDPLLGWTQGDPFCIPRVRTELHTIMRGHIGAANYQEIVGDTPGDATITATEDTDGTTDTRPKISFDTGTATQRPWLCRLHQANVVTMTVGSGAGETIDPTRVSWTRNSDWRGAQMTIDYADDAIGEAIVEVPHNAKVSFALCWDSGEDPAPTPAERVVGYTQGMNRHRAGDHRLGAAVPRIVAKDHPSSRLRKHFMRSMPTFQGWLASEIYEYILDSAGVPAALLTIDAAVDSSYVLPDGVPPWERHWGYSDTYSIESALDEMLHDYLGLQWGWDESGYFLRPRPTWGGIGVDTVDWTADRDQATIDQIITECDVMTSVADYANYVMEAIPDGNYWLAIDADSHLTDTDERYIGEDWWAVNSGANGMSDASAAAAAKLARLARHALTVTFTTAYTGLAPDMFVEIMNWDVPEIPDGSVFRILEENGVAWSDGRDNGIEITYTAGIEEFAAAV